MNSKTLIAALLGGLTLFVLGYIVYGLLLADFFASSVDRAEPLILYIGLGELVFGYLIVWVFSQTDTSTAADGAKAGAILGLLLFLGLNLIMYGVFEMYELSTNLVDVLVGTVRFGVAGAVVGWYLGRDASESASSEVASSESISSDLASTESASSESTSSDSAREGGF
ncbi:MAG: hypothetical protein O7C39_05825 [Bacteroidetes bacterium]|nr:hypothetical protein [Bacteroidota bacterium]